MPDQKYSVEELGRRVRAKGGSELSGYSDRQIGERVLQRNPSLGNLIDTSIVEDGGGTSNTGQTTSQSPGGISFLNPKPQEKSVEKPGLFSRAASGVGNFVVGAAKGVADVPREFASLGNDLGNKFSNTGVGKFVGKGIQTTLGKVVTPETAQALQQGIKEGTQQTAFTRPEGTAQKLGYGAEKIGEFFLPGGAATKASKAVETASALNKAPKVAKGLAFLTKVGTEGALAAGQTAQQEGELNNNALIAGGLGAASSVASKGLETVSKNLPENMWKKILNRTASTVEKKPGVEKEASKLGLFGTQKSILGTAKNTIQSVELELDDLLKNSTGQIETKNIVPYLDDLKKAYSQIPGEKSSVELIANLQDEIASKGVLSPLEANKIKREIYSKISKSYGKGTLEIPAKIDAQKQIARGLKEEIEKVIPEAKTLNQKQGIYIEIRNAIDKQIAQRPKGIAGTGIGLYDITLGGLGSAVGLGGGGPGLGFLAGIGAKKAYESTAFRSGAAKLAKYFNELSPTKKALFYNGLKGLTSQGIQILNPSKMSE